MQNGSPGGAAPSAGPGLQGFCAGRDSVGDRVLVMVDREWGAVCKEPIPSRNGIYLIMIIIIKNFHTPGKLHNIPIFCMNHLLCLTDPGSLPLIAAMNP
jgi:hypothetical protein